MTQVQRIVIKGWIPHLHTSLTVCNRLFRFTSGATPADLLMVNMDAKPFFHLQLVRIHRSTSIGGTRTWDRVCSTVCSLTVWALPKRYLITEQIWLVFDTKDQNWNLSSFLSILLEQVHWFCLLNKEYFSYFEQKKPNSELPRWLFRSCNSDEVANIWFKCRIYYSSVCSSNPSFQFKNHHLIRFLVIGINLFRNWFE